MKVEIGPYVDEGDRVIDIHIDSYDTWGMDHTLALIALPMLKQLKETKHGSPFVNMEDVPEELHAPEGWYEKYSTNGETDEHFFDRWDWVMDQMIWSMEQLVEDDNEKQYWGPWIEDETKSMGGYFESIDMEGLKNHNDRIDNGLRLFGKYFRSLWD